MNGNNGHDQNDVLYIAFTGSKAVPGANGAAWNAQSFDQFHNSITGLGNSLVAKIGGGSGGSGPPTTPTTTAGGSSPTCDWNGHCAGKRPTAYPFSKSL